MVIVAIFYMGQHTLVFTLVALAINISLCQLSSRHTQHDARKHTIYTRHETRHIIYTRHETRHIIYTRHETKGIKHDSRPTTIAPQLVPIDGISRSIGGVDVLLNHIFACQRLNGINYQVDESLGRCTSESDFESPRTRLLLETLGTFPDVGRER